MEWYLYSIIAMLSFSAMVLIIKKVRDCSFSSMQVNVFLFGFVFVELSLLVNIDSNRIMVISNSFWLFLVLLVLAAVAAIFANLADLKAVGIAPNPGYSQAVKNSNILPITVLSIFIFDLNFDLMKLIGAIFIILGIGALVLIKGNLKRPESTSWYLYSLVAVIFFTVMILILKKATLLGFSSIQINFFLFGFCLIGFLILGYKEAKSVCSDKQFFLFLGLIFLASFFSLIGNLSDVEAIKLAPNPGYAQAIKNANILVITFLSTRFFSSDFTFTKVAGAIVVLIGIVFLVI